MRKQSLFVGALIASLFWGGILVGRSTASIGSAVANARAAGNAERWDYNCFYKTSGGDGGLTKEAKDLGKEGWELTVGVSVGLANTFLLCFKRPLSAP
jgi:hypothetical protein